jgi:hypothetical protein
MTPLSRSRLRAWTWRWWKLHRQRGRTEGDGAYRFDVKLPEYFAGKPLSQGAARALIEATVKDAADHAETRGEPITVSEAPLLITAVPEGGTLIPHIENEVFFAERIRGWESSQDNIDGASAGWARGAFVNR